MPEIKNCFYRISVKALVLNETRDKFLIVKEENGKWELPGGGLDWGTTPQQDLPREIEEEMSLNVTYVADRPSYFYTFNKKEYTWIAGVVYETKLENLDFTPSDECVEIRFVDRKDVAELDAFEPVELLAEQFDPSKH